MEWNETLTSFLAALGLGLLNGVIRERRNLNDEDIAGTRTHALVAVLGFVTWSLGPLPFVACLGLVGALTVAGYLQTAHQDSGKSVERVPKPVHCVRGLEVAFRVFYAVVEQEFLADLGVVAEGAEGVHRLFPSSRAARVKLRFWSSSYSARVLLNSRAIR